MSIRNNETPNIREVETFVAVMSSGSMTAAAKRLGIGQPAVTRYIRDLESTLGFSVFERNGPRISPTRQGLSFYESAQNLLDSISRMQDKAASIRNETTETVAIAATPTMAVGMVPAILEGFDKLPKQVSLKSMDAEHVSEALQLGQADYGVSAFPLEHSSIECLASAKSKLVAAVKEDDKRSSISLNCFCDDRLITVGNSFRIRHAINQALAASDTEVSDEFTSNTSISALMAARAGLGVAVLDPVTSFGIQVEGIKILSLDQEIPYEWGLFRRLGVKLFTEEEQLIKGFIETSETICNAADM